MSETPNKRSFMPRSEVRVALLGVGTVGSQVARILAVHGNRLSRLIGARLRLIGIACRRPADVSDQWIDKSLLTDDPASLCPQADVVIEVMGGLEPARSLMMSAFENGASVVTANKALLSRDLKSLQQAAYDHHADLYYEAAVAGTIPVVRVLRESLAADQIISISGIVNGTTNYILDQMALKGISFDQALAQAQEQGYAEADPSADIDGYDSAAKAAIMACLAFGQEIKLDDVDVEGIRSVSQADVAAAAARGEVIRLLASVSRDKPDSTNGSDCYTPGSSSPLHVSVKPVTLPKDHELAGIHGSYNAVAIKARYAGDLMLTGLGAGGEPTASAVVSDLIAVAGNKVSGVVSPPIPLTSLSGSDCSAEISAKNYGQGV